MTFQYKILLYPTRRPRHQFYISSVIKQKQKSQKRCFKKTKHAKFSEKRRFLTPTRTRSRFCFKIVSRKQSMPKTNFSYSLIRTRTCAYQGVRNVPFRKIWRALFSWNTHFEIRPFALLSTIWYLTVFTFCDSNS